MINLSNRKVNLIFWSSTCAFLLCFLVLMPSLAAAQSLAKTSIQRQYGNYARYATGINIYGTPREWATYATQYGYRLSNHPVPGGVVTFESDANSSSNSYGVVGVVTYYYEDDLYWKIGVRYADPNDGATISYDYDYVKESEFRVLKNDPGVHYIYRVGENTYPMYYARPEYTESGQGITIKQVSTTKNMYPTAIYSDEKYVESYVKQGQPVRILAKAEIGERIWVFIQPMPSMPSKEMAYQKTYSYGCSRSRQLREFAANSPEAYDRYYAKSYGDNVVDIGYVDYSKLVGYNGKVIVTIKKGENPIELKTIQVISLQLQ